MLNFSSSLRRSTLAEVPGGGGVLLRQPLWFCRKRFRIILAFPVGDMEIQSAINKKVPPERDFFYEKSN